MFGLFKKKKVESLGDYQYQSMTNPVEEKSQEREKEANIGNLKFKTEFTRKISVSSKEVDTKTSQNVEEIQQIFASNPQITPEQLKVEMEKLGIDIKDVEIIDKRDKKEL